MGLRPAGPPMIRGLLASTALIAVLACHGCATVLAGGHTHLTVDVDAESENVRLDVRGIENDDVQSHRGAQASLMLLRGSSYAIGVSAPGHEPALVIIKRSVHPAYWLNFVPLGLGTGSFVYLASGSSGGALAGLALFLGSASVTSLFSFVDTVTMNILRHEQQAVRVELRPTAPVDR